MPECSEWVFRSKSVRLAMPSSSANSDPPKPNRYSMSIVRFGVVRQLLFRVLVVAQVVGVDAEADVPVPALLQPVVEPLLVGARRDEVLHLHLLELAGAEDEVAGRDLVAEALAGLGDAERWLLACRRHHVEEVDEDALGGLRAQVVHAGVVLDRAEEGLEHAGELLGLGPRATRSAVRAGDTGQPALGRSTLARFEVLLEVIGPEAVVAVGAFDERVGERRQVPGGLPHLRREDDRRVEPDDVVASGHHRAPPLPADVLLQLDAQRTVVPGGAAAAVDLTGGKDEATSFAQVDDGIVAIGGHGFSIRLAVGAGACGGSSSVSTGCTRVRRRSKNENAAVTAAAASQPAMTSEK